MSVMFSFLMDLHLIYMYFIFGSEVRRLIWSCPGSRSNGPTWFGGSRHWSRGRRKKFWVICQRYALANNSEFLCLPLLQCLLPPNQVGPLLLDPGQLQISRLTPLQKMKYIQIKCKIHQKRKHYNTHSLRAPFFSYVHTVHYPMHCLGNSEHVPSSWWVWPGASWRIELVLAPRKMRGTKDAIHMACTCPCLYEKDGCDFSHGWPAKLWWNCRTLLQTKMAIS